ncbi:MAG TPA: cytochrome b/b6 domain-containing protein, partial [Casimicrobiaceae bacterium]|nr:cytochrome b/b6 domain-containing protein [Casimicrobiaceae bacterium]
MRPEEAQYTTVAKVLHWLIAGILVLQFAIGWIMPSIRRGIQPGLAMHVHISTGIVVLGLIVVRLLWRLTHPVPPEAQLPRWQRSGSA